MQNAAPDIVCKRTQMTHDLNLAWDKTDADSILSRMDAQNNWTAARHKTATNVSALDQKIINKKLKSVNENSSTFCVLRTLNL